MNRVWAWGPCMTRQRGRDVTQSLPIFVGLSLLFPKSSHWILQQFYDNVGPLLQVSLPSRYCRWEKHLILCLPDQIYFKANGVTWQIKLKNFCFYEYPESQCVFLLGRVKTWGHLNNKQNMFKENSG